MKRDMFKQLVTSLLTEADENEKKIAREDSLDAQVDKFLIAYEADSKEIKKESFNFRSSMRALLLEEEEEEEETDDAEDAEDEPADALVKKLPAEDLNMEEFVNNVMRLVENYDSLLEIRDTILKRALNFIAKNYKKDAPRNFEDTILDLYGVKIGSSSQDVADEINPAPLAGAAGPAGGAG